MANVNQVNMVTIDCPLCGGKQHLFERVVEEFALKKCQGCGFVFVNPQYSFESLMQIYQDKKDSKKIIEIYARIATPLVLAEYDRKLDQLERMLGRKGKILDFACAAAYFVERANKKGWDAYGVDVGSWVKEAAEARGVRNIYIGQLASLNFPDGYFDIIYAAQVLEHLQSPLSTLAEIRRILKPSGILYVDVPNYHTIPIMLNKDDFYLNTPPQHINYFTPKTLKLLLERSGFKINLLTTEGGLKWENLIGRPIISDIADAYRDNNSSNKLQKKSAVHQSPLLFIKGIFFPLLKRILYDWAKVGINLVAITTQRLPD